MLKEDDIWEKITFFPGSSFIINSRTELDDTGSIVHGKSSTDQLYTVKYGYEKKFNRRKDV